MLTTPQIDHFTTFGFAVLPGFFADRAATLRAEADATIRDAYAATYHDRVIDGISGHYLPMAARRTPVSARRWSVTTRASSTPRSSCSAARSSPSAPKASCTSPRPAGTPTTGSACAA
jgi:hypothetical protein